MDNAQDSVTFLKMKMVHEERGMIGRDLREEKEEIEIPKCRKMKEVMRENKEQKICAGENE